MGDVRISQEAIEILRGGDPNVRISQEAIEILRGGDPDIRISQIAIEVLSSSGDPGRKGDFFLVL